MKVSFHTHVALPCLALPRLAWPLCLWVRAPWGGRGRVSGQLGDSVGWSLTEKRPGAVSLKCRVQVQAHRTAPPARGSLQKLSCPKSCTRSKSASSSGPPKFPINRPPPTLARRFRFPLLSLSSSKPPGFPGHSHPQRTEAIITRASEKDTPLQLHPAPCTLCTWPTTPLRQHSPLPHPSPLYNPPAAGRLQNNNQTSKNHPKTTKTTTAMARPKKVEEKQLAPAVPQPVPIAAPQQPQSVQPQQPSLAGNNLQGRVIDVDNFIKVRNSVSASTPNPFPTCSAMPKPMPPHHPTPPPISPAALPPSPALPEHSLQHHPVWVPNPTTTGLVTIKASIARHRAACLSSLTETRSVPNQSSQHPKFLHDKPSHQAPALYHLLIHCPMHMQFKMHPRELPLCFT